jgi:hypothetical protein
MRKLLLAACLSALAITQVHANDTSAKTGKPLTDQQQKMKDCNAEAKTQALKGDPRKAFMKECLSKNGAPAAAPAKPAAAAPAAAPAAAAPAPAPAAAAAAAPATDKKTSQKEKMKSCNADAKTKNLKGDDRKAFMSSCLKG